jgi:putative spermidine/putrescine transport system substrate-binding protein
VAVPDEHARGGEGPGQGQDKQSPGSAKQYHCGESAAYFNSIKFWKTPIPDCGNGQTDCKDYNAWNAAWQEIKG